MKREDVARMIDHTLLKPTATPGDIERLVEEAIDYGFYSVCVNPCYVPLAVSLSQNKVKVITVIGFPLGANPVDIKVAEALWAVDAGASEIDMVMNIGLFKAGDFKYIEKEISEVVKKSGVPVKVIIETAYLDRSEKVEAARIVKDSGASFVKTSTGFAPSGATVEDVKLLRETVGPDFGVKASGGIRSWEDAVKMIEAGANRIGTSSGVAIIKGYKGQEEY